MKKGLTILLAIAMLFSIVGCSEKIKNVDVSSIKVTDEVLFANQGTTDSLTFGASAQPENAFDTTLIYTMDADSTYQTQIDKDGVVTFGAEALASKSEPKVIPVTISSKMNPTVSRVCYIAINTLAPSKAADFGTVTATWTKKGIDYTVDLRTATESNVTYIYTTDTQLEISGDTLQHWSYINTTTHIPNKFYSGVTYSSSDEGVVTVDSASGKVTAFGPGEAEVIITSKLPYKTSTTGTSFIGDSSSYDYASTRYTVKVNAITTTSELIDFLANDKLWAGVKAAYLDCDLVLYETLTVKGIDKTLILNGHKLKFDVSEGNYTTSGSLFELNNLFVIDGTADGSAVLPNGTTTSDSNFTSIFKTNGKTLYLYGGTYGIENNRFDAISTTSTDIIAAIYGGSSDVLIDGAKLYFSVKSVYSTASNIYGVKCYNLTLKNSACVDVSCSTGSKVLGCEVTYFDSFDSIVKTVAYGDSIAVYGNSVVINGGTVSVESSKPSNSVVGAILANNSCELKDVSVVLKGNGVDYLNNESYASYCVKTKYLDAVNSDFTAIGTQKVNFVQPANFNVASTWKCTNCDMKVVYGFSNAKYKFFYSTTTTDLDIDGGVYSRKEVTGDYGEVIFFQAAAAGENTLDISSSTGLLADINLVGKDVCLVTGRVDTTIISGNYKLDADNKAYVCDLTSNSDVAIMGDANFDVESDGVAVGFHSVNGSVSLGQSKVDLTGARVYAVVAPEISVLGSSSVKKTEIDMTASISAVALSNIASANLGSCDINQVIGANKLSVQYADVDIKAATSGTNLFAFVEVAKDTSAEKTYLLDSDVYVKGFASVCGVKATNSYTGIERSTIDIEAKSTAAAIETNSSADIKYCDVDVETTTTASNAIFVAAQSTDSNLIDVYESTVDVKSGKNAFGFTKAINAPMETRLRVNNSEFTVEGADDAVLVLSVSNASGSNWDVEFNSSDFVVTGSDFVYGVYTTNSDIYFNDVDATVTATKTSGEVYASVINAKEGDRVIVSGGTYEAIAPLNNVYAEASVFNVRTCSNLKVYDGTTNPLVAYAEGYKAYALYSDASTYNYIGGSYEAKGTYETYGVKLSDIASNNTIYANTEIEVSSAVYDINKDGSLAEYEKNETTVGLSIAADTPDSTTKETNGVEFASVKSAIINSGLTIEAESDYGTVTGLSLAYTDVDWYGGSDEVDADIDVEVTSGNAYGVKNYKGNIHFINDSDETMIVNVDAETANLSGYAYALDNENSYTGSVNTNLKYSYIDVDGDAVITFTSTGCEHSYGNQTITNYAGLFYSYVNSDLTLATVPTLNQYEPNQWLSVLTFDNVN